jgi:hypothetical protein
MLIRKYNHDKILLECEESERFVYEPLVRKLGGLWMGDLSGWLFAKNKELEIKSLILKTDQLEIQENYDWALHSPKTIQKSPQYQSQEDINMDLYSLVDNLNQRIVLLEHICKDR